MSTDVPSPKQLPRFELPQIRSIEVVDDNSVIEQKSAERSAGTEEEILAVCLPLTEPLVMVDNVIGVCSICSKQIQYRPDVPKLKKMCMDCFQKEVEKQQEPISLMVTTKQQQDIQGATGAGLWELMTAINSPKGKSRK